MKCIDTVNYDVLNFDYVYLRAIAPKIITQWIGIDVDHFKYILGLNGTYAISRSSRKKEENVTTIFWCMPVENNAFIQQYTR
jgi:hypothetical protein